MEARRVLVAQHNFRPRAVFQHKDGLVAALGQPVGYDQAGGATADDDKVILGLDRAVLRVVARVVGSRTVGEKQEIDEDVDKAGMK